MTQEKYRKAQEFEMRIASISELIELFSGYDYKLEPPTRQSNFAMQRDGREKYTLNEAEAVLFLNALVDEKNRLEEEFERL